jgi:hypothetical protein
MNVKDDAIRLLRLRVFRITVVLSVPVNVWDFDVVTVSMS